MGEKLTLHVKPDISEVSLAIYSSPLERLDPRIFSRPTGRVNLLFGQEALGCVNCLRLRSEIIHECGIDSTPEKVLSNERYELDIMSPYIRTIGENYLEISCPLMDVNNLLPDARQVEPPCLDKKTITIELD